MRRFLAGIAALALLAVAAAPVGAVTSPWTASPGQSVTYATSVQQPINADGSSVYKAARGVIPVQFSLQSGVGPFVFSSTAANPYSYLSYAPPTALTVAGITNLSANYLFTAGNCAGGAIRWSISTPSGHIFVYYGTAPNFTDCNGAASQSGTNMVSLSDLRFDTSQVGGTFYDSWANVLATYGTLSVNAVTLVVDANWAAGDQVITLSSATVNADTFTPAASSPLASTCNLPPATIKISYQATSISQPADETLVSAVNDSGTSFRIVGCKYIYNLSVSSLSGQGIYTVSAVINGTPATGSATFTLK
ncbi:MAG TPA: hypothetical protein VE011_02295 [Candidatus Dormibacteraeota bacterium]|nr:hypothetical protein [Candidatus Dormibacteraeota bacterium]